MARRHRILGAGLAGLSALALVGAAPAEPEAAARGLADRFQQELLKALSAAMASGGPTQAIGLCAEEAPAIAARLSKTSGAIVRRTALRVRNPAATPDAYERSVLKRLAAAPLAEGKPREVSAWTGGSQDRQFRYMRAIPTAPMCLTCHGTAVDPALAAEIRRLYPGDAAVGFNAGDLRGAFSIRWDAAGLAAYLDRSSRRVAPAP